MWLSPVFPLNLPFYCFMSPCLTVPCSYHGTHRTGPRKMCFSFFLQGFALFIHTPCEISHFFGHRCLLLRFFGHDLPPAVFCYQMIGSNLPTSPLFIQALCGSSFPVFFAPPSFRYLVFHPHSPLKKTLPDALPRFCVCQIFYFPSFLAWHVTASTFFAWDPCFFGCGISRRCRKMTFSCSFFPWPALPLFPPLVSHICLSFVTVFSSLKKGLQTSLFPPLEFPPPSKFSMVFPL